MTLKEQILQDKAIAFKSGNKELNTLLGTVIGELDRISKLPTDTEVINIIKKMIESATECNLINEVNWLQLYMPEPLKDYELINIISTYCKDNNITEKKQMGLVMKYLKDNFNGRYDGKDASLIISNILK